MIQINHIHIWQIDLDGPVHSISSLLSADETARANELKQTQMQARFIRGRGAMRSILGDYLDTPGNELRLIREHNGKPSLAFPESDIEFNLTHCENMALLAVAINIPVGVDLERVRHKSEQLKIAQRMFSDAIYKELRQLPPKQLALEFFRHWTELEARTKCVGDGIFSRENERSDVTTQHFYPEDGWVACVATRGVDIATMELKHFVYGN
jgi:4'-phosphopantetheinyl transferase